MSTDATPKPSPVEGIKESSRYLRGTLPEELAEPTDHFTEQAKQLVKFHGSYQQEDRDARKNRPKTGTSSKAYVFMIRLKLPGGKLTADQYLAMDDLAGKYANGTLRVTTRQSFQFHGVLKSDLKATIAGINHTLLTTLGGCGDVNRNVMACPAPTGDPVRAECQKLADAVAAHLAPRAGARSYHEIWLNGEPQQVPAAEHENPEAFEPIYGRHYLPRKFKVGFALPNDNCTDLLAQCLGFLAVEGGYDLYAGGGQGLTNSKPDTFACLAQPVGFVLADEVVAASEGIIKLFRDHGNRSDRKRARLKYVMHDWGVEKFRDVFYRDYFTGPRRPPSGTPITGLDLHLGWQPQADGRWFLGLSVENGRIKDEGSMRLRTALREIVRRLRCDVRLTAQQDVLLCGLTTADRPTVDAVLSDHGVPRAEALSQVQKWSLACPAIPTCPLAISESERALPGLVDQLEATLSELGLAEEPISVRMTGCPNGCARPYQSEIGIVGRSGDKYTLYVGGDSFGRRMNTQLLDLVPRGEIVPKLRAVFGTYRDERTAGESFGAYCERVGVERLKAALLAV